jgi:phage FluMu gp28-like protein
MNKAQKLIEIGKCMKDPIYAIETYLETEDRTQGGFVPFKLFPRQKELVNGYVNHQHNIVMKPRQAGISTTTAAYAAILTALASKKAPEKILIAANKQETAKEFLKKIKDFTSQLPDWMDVNRPPGSESWFDKEKNSSSHYKLWNGSEVKAVASSKDALRGYAPSLIIIDEAAFIEGSRGEEFYEAAQPSLSTGGHSILISTPNGYDPLYHKTYQMAKSGDNNFNVVEMRWFEDPRYNKGLRWIRTEVVDGEEVTEEMVELDKTKWDGIIADGWEATSPWFENMCAQLNHNARSIAQELLCSFLGSGDQVIDDKYKKRQEKENVKEPIRKEWIDGQMWIWEDPIDGHRYIMGVDAASGSSDDFGSIWVLDYDTGNQVAEYRGKVQPDVLGEIATHYGESYDAFVVVDLTGGYGISTVLKMLELGYSSKRMYYDTAFGIDALEKNKQLEKHMRNGKLPGLNFQAKRHTIISNMEQAVRLNSIKIRSVRTINEIDTFVFVNGRPDHQKGYHDDLLMAMAMCNFVGMTSFKDLEKSKGQAKAMINSWAVTTTDTETISELNTTSVAGFYTDNKKQQQTLQQTKEYNWLFSGFGEKRRKR